MKATYRLRTEGATSHCCHLCCPLFTSQEIYMNSDLHLIRLVEMHDAAYVDFANFIHRFNYCLAEYHD